VPAMQAPLSGERGILPALFESGMESGKLDEFRLSAGDDFAALCDNTFLDTFLLWNFPTLKCEKRINHKDTRNTKKDLKSL
jgi:hypothetical protein